MTCAIGSHRPDGDCGALPQQHSDRNGTAGPRPRSSRKRPANSFQRNLQNSTGRPLPHGVPSGPGSVRFCKHAGANPSRARQQAVSRVLQVPLQSVSTQWDPPCGRSLAPVTTALFFGLPSRAEPANPTLAGGALLDGERLSPNSLRAPRLRGEPDCGYGTISKFTDCAAVPVLARASLSVTATCST